MGRPKKGHSAVELQREVDNLKLKISNMQDRWDAVREALADVLGDTFVGKDEAEEIARDAVSERIW